MAKSRRGCTPAQQRMCNAFTSRFSAVAAELLISPCALQQTSLLGTKIPFPTDSMDFKFTVKMILRG